MKPTGTDDKPASDQSSLQRLLSAAFVVQQHNERLQNGQPPETAQSQILKEILEVQEQLRATHLDLREKSALIARRARQMAQASGCAVGVLSGSQLEYYAATGSAASQAGAEVPQDHSLAHECLRTGQLLECPSAESDSRLNPELCHSLGVKALIAVPVKHEGKVGGVLEFYFADANFFHEQEVRVAQLMSALVAEAILKPVHQEAHESVPVAPAELPNLKDTESLLAALEKIRPKLEHLASNAGMASIAANAADHVTPGSSGTRVCRSCGHAISDDEIFCSVCGSSRQTKRIWSSLLELQRKAENSPRRKGGSAADADAFDEPLDLFPSELEEIVAKFSSEPFDHPAAKTPEVSLPSFAQELVAEKISAPAKEVDEGNTFREQEEANTPEDEAEPAASLVDADPAPEVARPFLLEKPQEITPIAETYPPFTGFASDTNLLSLPSETEPETSFRATPQPDEGAIPWRPSLADNESSAAQGAPWGSAANTKEWLETQRGKGAWLAKRWQQHRANVYLVAAAVLLVVVLLGLAAPSPPAATARKTPGANASRQEEAPQADLSLSEKLLISLGLAEAPAVEVVKPGNPDTQVWIDVHTALYYCPGSERYSKTPGGRTESQRQAQEDHFQPALGKTCD